MTVLSNQENYQLDGLWQMEHRYFAQFENVSLPLGGLTLHDCQELYKLVKKHCHEKNINSVQIADVGCWTGMSSLVLAMAAEKFNGNVHSVDWFQGSDKTNLSFAGKYFNIKNIFLDNIKEFDFGKRIKLIEGKTTDVATQFSDGYFDLVFLDADHRYHQVVNDINTWLPKVKNGGIICGHDCEILLKNGFQTIFNAYVDEDMINKLHIGVCKAVSDIFPDAKHTDSGTIWYFEKNF